MIAAKQKAAGKTSKLGLAVAGKSESGSKAGAVSIGESSDTNIKSSPKGKTPAKLLKKGMTFKRKDEGGSEVKTLGLKSKPSLKVTSKAAKKVASVESDSESENLDLESLPTGQSQKVKQDKKKTTEVEKVEDQVKSNEDQKEDDEEQAKDSEAEQGGKVKVSKVKKVSRKKDEGSEESDDAVGKPKTKQLNEDKNEEDIDSEIENETKPKAVSAKNKTPKKSSKKSAKEEDEEQDLEAEAKSKAASAKGSKAKVESRVKEELDSEVKEESGAGGKRAKGTTTEPGSEVKPGGSEKKTKKAKEEEGELHTADSETDEDQKSDSESVKVKKTPGRKRKEKTKEEPVVVTSTRRSKRESNLSVKLAEWGLVPLGKHLLYITTIWYVSVIVFP